MALIIYLQLLTEGFIDSLNICNSIPAKTLEEYNPLEAHRKILPLGRLLKAQGIVYGELFIFRNIPFLSGKARVYGLFFSN